MNEAHLGQFLKEKRQQIDPKSLNIVLSRRRTPGLRREEVAQRANISVTWYTWLEQGRGGMPSAPVLHRIANALMLNKSEIEYLFLTTLGRLPETEYSVSDMVTPQMQSILDALNPNPAMIRNLAWDILAWNQAAAATLVDYNSLPPNERNVMNLYFSRKEPEPDNPDWQDTARLLVSAFRVDLARLGSNEKTDALIEKLMSSSKEFAQLWNSHDVLNFSDGVKNLHRPDVGKLSMNYSSFEISGTPELSMVVYTPKAEEDRKKIEQLMK